MRHFLKMLITQLRDLVENGILIKNEYEEIPRRVEYHIAISRKEAITGCLKMSCGKNLYSSVTQFKNF